MGNKTCINIIQCIGVLFLVLLTACEILSAFIIFAMEIYQLNVVLKTSFFQQKQHDLFITSVLFLVASCILCIAFILQWSIFCSNSRYYRKFAYSIRNIANILFTAAAIYHLIVMRQSNEIKIFERVISHWDDESYGAEFERKNECSSLSDCQTEIIKAFDHVFKNGRGMKAPIALFWCSIIFYGLFSIISIIFAKYIFK